MGQDSPIVKICIAVPNEGHTLPEAYDNRMLMMLHLGMLQERSKWESVDLRGGGPERLEFYHFTAGRLLTPAAREALADNALSAGMDYLFMIDDDMICPIDLFEKLYRHNVDIVAPLAFTRNAPHYAVLYECKKGWDPVAKNDYFINHYVRNYPKDSLVRCDAVGFGSVLIKMDVVRKMRKPYFMSTCGTGEDVLFCYKAFEGCGARTYMDTSVSLGHLSNPAVITQDYAEWYWANVEKRDIAKQDKPFDKYDVQPMEGELCQR